MWQKRRVYEILEVTHPEDKASSLFEIFILSLITLNVVALVAETVRSLYSQYSVVFNWFEAGSVLIFSVEYVARLWSSTACPDYAGAIRGRIRFAFTPLAIVDFFSIAPFYLPWVGVNFLFLRAIRLFRFFRSAKLARYSHALRTFGRVLSRKKEELLVAGSLLLTALLFASALLYFAESDAQPNKFSSIPASMWWAVMTLTTVGYGDMYPVTVFGKLIGSLVAILGVGVVAMPTGILAAGLLEEMGSRATHVCPHCGHAFKV